MLANLECPVELIDYQLYASKTTGRIHGSLMFNNLSNKTVKGLKVIIYCYDPFGDPVGGDEHGFESKIEFKEGLAPHCKQAADRKIMLPDLQQIRKIEVDILKILFDDNTLWSKGATISERVELEPIDKPEVLDYVQSRAGADAKYIAKDLEDQWVCVCGRLNRQDQTNCKRCRREKDEVLREYSDEGTIIHNLKIYREAKEEQNRRAQERMGQQFSQKKQKDRRISTYSSILVAILLVVGTFVWIFLAKSDGFDSKQSAEEEKNIVVGEREEAAADPKLEEEQDGIISTFFQSYGRSNGHGSLIIVYLKNGDAETKIIENITEPKIVDLDNNGIEEFVITRVIKLPGFGNAEMPTWDDVYDFDIASGELDLASDKYPDYYSNDYIPTQKKRSAESNDSVEKQALSTLIQAAEDLVNGKFFPDSEQKTITRLLEVTTKNNPLHIEKRSDGDYYIHGVTLGMKIDDVINMLGEPDEAFEINSNVARWHLENNLVLDVEYGMDTIHYIDLGEFDQTTLEDMKRLLGKPTTSGKNEFSYITPTQELRFHEMSSPTSFRVQLLDPDMP